MNQLSRFVFAAAALAAAPAQSEIRETSPGRYSCDTPAGQYERLDVSGFFDTSNAMAARIRMIEARRDPDAYSAASLNFVLEGDKRARIMVLASPEGDDFLWVGIVPPINAPGQQMAAYRLGQTVEVSGTMTRGAVFARSRNERGQIYVGEARLTGREIMCSSGRFEIELVRNPRPARRY